MSNKVEPRLETMRAAELSVRPTILTESYIQT